MLSYLRTFSPRLYAFPPGQEQVSHPHQHGEQCCSVHTREFETECENKLIEKIMEDLRSKVKAFVRKTKPYDCHVFE